MAWWQIALAAWAAGAVGTFPCAFEFHARPEEEGQLSEPHAAVLASVSAVGWPIAWLALMAYFASKAVRRG